MRAENAYHGLSEMEGSESDASDTDEEDFNSCDGIITSIVIII